MMEPKNLYQDAFHEIAVKPAGMLSQPDKTGDAAMTDILSERIGKTVLPVHRLDRAVGGVMVFALTKEAAGKLGGILGTNAFQKEYLTVVDGIPAEKEGTLEDYLLHDARRNMTSVVSAKTKDAKAASLSYTLLETHEKASLLRVLLHTGRTHQIRVQFSSRAMPILGDGRYGSRERHPVALWSYRLSFSDPMTKKRLMFQAIPDMTTPWDLFSAYDNLK